jgi:TfoX/Sxy family transcriptional regulator of competence genes
MAFDEVLAGRVRSILSRRSDVVERKMFGGIAFIVSGSMACGVVADDLMVRVGPERHEAALARPHARPMDFTGRPLRGMVYVAAAGLATDSGLEAWVAEAVSVATSASSAPTRSRSIKKVLGRRRSR